MRRSIERMESLQDELFSELGVKNSTEARARLDYLHGLAEKIKECALVVIKEIKQ